METLQALDTELMVERSLVVLLARAFSNGALNICACLGILGIGMVLVRYFRPVSICAFEFGLRFRSSAFAMCPSASRGSMRPRHRGVPRE